jgi:hypothetical protein
MIERLRARDALLVCYYLVFLTINAIYLIGFRDRQTVAMGFFMLGMASLVIVAILHDGERKLLRFSEYAFRAFLLLMAVLLAADFLTIVWPKHALWLGR